MRFLTLVSMVLVVGGTAAGQRSAARSSTRSAPVKRPLEALAREHILVLPVQYVTFLDTLGWSSQAPQAAEYLAALDDEITFALGDRGLKGRWTFSDAVTRSVQRNPQLTVDPHALDAGEVRIGSRPDEWQLHEPLASQLRSLIALGEARYVLLPVELRFANAPGGGAGRLHVVVIDARRSAIQWAGDVLGAPAAKFSPALAADLASRLADLVAPPRR